MRAFLTRIFVACVLACTAGAASAHIRSESSSNWTIDGRLIHAEISIPNIEAVRLSSDHQRPSDATIINYLKSRVGASADGGACEAAQPPQMMSAAAAYRRAEFQFDCPSTKNMKIRFSAFFDIVSTHTDLAQIQLSNGDFVEQIFTKDTQTLAVDQDSKMASAGILDFMGMGIMHIFTGIDHMSFLLGLVLISRKLRDLLFVVTGFTIGHSFSLGLSVIGIIRPHADFIDALVALTIALIGMENIVIGLRRPTPAALTAGGFLMFLAALRLAGIGLLPPLLLAGAALFTTSYLMVSSHVHNAGRLRILVTLVFGLIHGFGFASGLLEMRLPREKLAEILFGFNMGVEVGQVTVVLVIISFVMLARRARLATPRPITVDVLSSFLVGIGTFWFISRSFM